MEARYFAEPVCEYFVDVALQGVELHSEGVNGWYPLFLPEKAQVGVPVLTTLTSIFGMKNTTSTEPTIQYGASSERDEVLRYTKSCIQFLMIAERKKS